MSTNHQCFPPAYDPRRVDNWECGACGRVFQPIDPKVTVWRHGQYGWLEVRGPRMVGW